MKSKDIAKYLDELRTELSGLDKAIIRDALADAEEHLSTAQENEQAEHTETPTEELIQAIISDYGTPAEIADAYRTVEAYASPTLAASKRGSNGNVFARFFGVYADARAWGALLYMFIAFLTGIIYFTWAITGLSLSLVFALFIFGLPFALLFILSIKGLGLLEGRIVEALLGVRMPRRAVFSPKNLKWRARLKSQLLDKYTWFALAYVILQGVWGTIYFVLFTTLIAFSFGFMAMPITQLVFNLPIGDFDGVHYYLPETALPLAVLLGLVLLTGTLHLAKLIGKLHGKYAKALLVSE